jgi:hypothetical protein
MPSSACGPEKGAAITRSLASGAAAVGFRNSGSQVSA